MKDQHNISDHLLISYLNQTTSVDEAQVVEEWLASDKANQLELDKIELVWEKSESIRDFEAISIDKNWKSLQGKIHPAGRSNESRWQIWKYAAAVLLIAAVSFILIRPGQVAIRQLAASDGPSELELSDGTIVWLNKGATLDYPEQFNASTREVTLTGEAFFDVMHNPDQPFIVTADGTKTEVLGTTFTISEEEGEVLKLVLATGKVRFTRGDQQATLAPGQVLEVDAIGQVSLRENDNPNFMAWKTRKLSFDNTPMKEVIGDIGSLYNVVLEIKGKQFLNCPLTTTFQDETLEDVLETIELLFNIEIQQNGQLYQLIGKGCNEQ